VTQYFALLAHRHDKTAEILSEVDYDFDLTLSKITIAVTNKVSNCKKAYVDFSLSADIAAILTGTGDMDYAIYLPPHH